MERVSNFVGKYMAVIIAGLSILALLCPATGLWIKTAWINYFLMIIMFGMGLTMKIDDFMIVFRQPRDVLIGCLSQFIIMPLLAFMLGKAFGLDVALLTGVVLVGTCPGGTASNVITYLAEGDVALSVGMTSINTLLAAFLTPAITYLLLRTSVEVDIVKMFISILQVVIIPIGLGLLLNWQFERYTQKFNKILPLVSIIAIALIVAAIIAANAEKIISTGIVILAVVFLHNLLGIICGYGVASLFGMNFKRKKALAVEVGMQNSGLATSLANSAFSQLAMATVPGAIFSVWHNISGAIFVSICKYIKDRHPEE